MNEFMASDHALASCATGIIPGLLRRSILGAPNNQPGTWDCVGDSPYDGCHRIHRVGGQCLCKGSHFGHGSRAHIVDLVFTDLVRVMRP